MANNFDSNFTRTLAKVFLKRIIASRVLIKTVDTQLLTGKFNPDSGANVDFKRPTAYRSVRSSGGDITGTKRDIIAGKATGTVKDFFTVPMDYNNVDEALKMGQLDELIGPAITGIINDLEVDFGLYMMKNCNLSYGTPGTAVDAWSDVAGAGALLDATGVPSDSPWYYIMSPGQEVALSPAQSALASGSVEMVNNSFQRAMIHQNFGGMQVMRSNALPSRTVTTAADLAGTLSATPTATYVTYKDTMTQSLAVAGFTADAVVKAGDIVEITGRYRVNRATNQVVFDASGNRVKFRGVVTADVTLSGTGTGTLVVAGPGIYEASGAYNSVDSALTSGDVITILGTSAATVQPAMFYHPQAFGLGFAKLPKLHSTDTVVETEDGLSFRVSKYADGDANKQTVRFDLLPAYATFNPFFAGQGFGV